MTLSKSIRKLSRAVEKNDLLKGFLIGGATVIGTEGALFIRKKVREKKLNSKRKQ